MAFGTMGKYHGNYLGKIKGNKSYRKCMYQLVWYIEIKIK